MAYGDHMTFGTILVQVLQNQIVMMEYLEDTKPLARRPASKALTVRRKESVRMIKFVEKKINEVL